MNNITVTGNLTRDPDLRYAGERPVANFSVASNRSWKNKTTGDWEEETTYFACHCWGPLAENVAASLTKGAAVVLEGRILQRSYTTKEGDERTVIELLATSVGASLKNASVQVTRNERTTPGQAAPAADTFGDDQPF